MKKRLLLLVFLALIPLVEAVAATPPKAGASCSKLGLTSNYIGKKFTCIKNGKKLVWDSGKSIQSVPPKSQPSNPTPSPTASPISSPATPSNPVPTISQNPLLNFVANYGVKQKISSVTYAPPSVSSDEIEKCKVKQAGSDGTKSGFPAPTPLYKATGTVTWAMIPVDFVDLKGEENFMKRAQSQMQAASEWADNTSEGKLKIEWKVHDKWIRLPGSSKEYAIPISDNKGFASPTQQSVWLKVVTEADKYFDFTGIQAVQFILPAGQTIIEYGIKGNNGYEVVRNYVTGEGTHIDFFSIPSTFNDELNSGRNYWSWWMYHYMVGLGVAKYGGSKIATPLHSYLIQGSTEGERELGGWIRFLVGWMSDDRVYCKTFSNLSKLEITLVPLVDNKTQGIKLAVFPITDKKALVLESRRVTKFSCTTNTERNGVLAYVYDSNLGHEEEYFKAISPSGRSVESYSCFASPTIDFLLHEGDKITYEGITVEVLAHGDYDQVRVSRES